MSKVGRRTPSEDVRAEKRKEKIAFVLSLASERRSRYSFLHREEDTAVRRAKSRLRHRTSCRRRGKEVSRQEVAETEMRGRSLRNFRLLRRRRDGWREGEERVRLSFVGFCRGYQPTRRWLSIGVSFPIREARHNEA